MKMTPALKAWLVANCSVKAEASDEEFKIEAGKVLGDKLTVERFGELTKDAKSDEANQFASKLDGIANGLEKLLGVLSQKSEAPKPEEKKPEEKPTEVKETKETKAVETKEKKAGRISKMLASSGSIEDDNDEISVHVKEAAERYSTTKSALTYPMVNKSGVPHPLAGQPVMDYSGEGGRAIDSPSQRDKAVIGAYAKFMINSNLKRSKTLAWMTTSDHEKELIMYAVKHMDWCGNIGDDPMSEASHAANVINRRLSPHEQKAIIDDATSGGTEAVPIVFDDALVTTPLLNGEFFPLVNVVPIDKGRRIQGAAALNPTIEWGGIDDTSVTLFDTTAFITAFDTTIYRGQGSIWIGLDFLSDTPIDFASFIQERYGEAMLREMDNVVCVGNGTTQPEGVMTKAGTTSIAFGGSTSIGNYESLMFGVHVRELTGPLMKTAVFGGTWTSYQRAKAIAVGASDYRRLSQTVTMPDYITGPNSRQWMGMPYKISDTMTNAQLFFAILGRYRMYRRRGLVIRNSTEGDTLIRKNEMLMVAMFRFGGQLERAACACITTTAPA